MNTRILTLAGTPHPKAAVQSIDLATGTLVFRWLDVAAQSVDSGGSVARFEPVLLTPATETEPAVYADPSDDTLVAAIAAALVDPPAPVPAEVTPLQMRRALNAAGLRATVEAAVAADDQETKDAWEFASTIRRDNALLAGMGTALGLTTEQIDNLFRQAAAN